MRLNMDLPLSQRKEEHFQSISATVVLHQSHKLSFPIVHQILLQKDI